MENHGLIKGDSVMNRQQRRAQGIKGKKENAAIANEAIQIARDLIEKNFYEQAKDLYLKILKVDPDNTRAIVDLAIHAIRGGYLEEAEEYLDKSLRVNPKNAPALVSLATIRMQQLRMNEGLKLVERALRLNPSPILLNRISVLLIDAGEFERAEAYLTEAIQKQPDLIDAYYQMKLVRKYRPEDISSLLDIERKRQLSLEDKIRLEFTLGDAYFDTGNADEAFSHYGTGNLLKRSRANFDIGKFEQYVDNCIRLFDKELVTRLRGVANQEGPRPIFIIGLPRSGSTLVDQILSSHPQVSSMGETKFLQQSLPLFPNEEIPNFFGVNVPTITRKFVEVLSPAVLVEVAKKYHEMTDSFVESGRSCLINKMLFNFLWVGMTRLAFPQSKTIHCTRDPIDCGLSMWRLLFSEEMPWAYDLKEMGRYIGAYRKLMAHWNSLFPGDIYELSYEAMVENQETESRKLLAYCDLPWDDGVLRFNEKEGRVATASVAQVRKPIYKDSVKKWKKYEAHLKPLIDTLGVTK